MTRNSNVGTENARQRETFGGFSESLISFHNNTHLNGKNDMISIVIMCVIGIIQNECLVNVV